MRLLISIYIVLNISCETLTGMRSGGSPACDPTSSSSCLILTDWFKFKPTGVLAGEFLRISSPSRGFSFGNGLDL